MFSVFEATAAVDLSDKVNRVAVITSIGVIIAPPNSVPDGIIVQPAPRGGTVKIQPILRNELVQVEVSEHVPMRAPLMVVHDGMLAPVPSESPGSYQVVAHSSEEATVGEIPRVYAPACSFRIIVKSAEEREKDEAAAKEKAEAEEKARIEREELAAKEKAEAEAKEEERRANAQAEFEAKEKAEKEAKEAAAQKALDAEKKKKGSKK